jgi:hypothetical protein
MHLIYQLATEWHSKGFAMSSAVGPSPPVSGPPDLVCLLRRGFDDIFPSITNSNTAVNPDTDLVQLLGNQALLYQWSTDQQLVTGVMAVRTCWLPYKKLNGLFPRMPSR